MAKTRSNGEGNIRLRSDGRYEVRVSGGVDFTTGQHIRISRYANSIERHAAHSGISPGCNAPE